MSLQANLIKTLLKHDNYEIYGPYISKHHFSREDKKDFFYPIYETLSGFHKENESDISLDDLQSIHLSSLEGASKDRRDAIAETYETIRHVGEDAASNSDAAKHLLTTLKRKHKAGEAIEVLLAEADNPSQENWIKLKDIADDAVTAADEEEIFYTTDITVGDEDYQASMRWKWFDPTFNEAVKGAGPGRNCLIFALTNVGKTSWATFNAINFMKQGAKVLHFSIAEDSKVALLRRYYQAAFNSTDTQLDQNKEMYAEKFAKMYGDKLFLCPTDSLTVARAEQLIKEVKPDIVVFDDYKDLELGYKGETKAPKIYGVLAAKIKALSIKYNFFAVCCAQAADTATGKQILERTDIADSRVDIPAKFEYCIGLSRGANQSNNIRYVSLAKNKKGVEGVHFGYAIEEATCQWRIA